MVQARAFGGLKDNQHRARWDTATAMNPAQTALTESSPEPPGKRALFPRTEFPSEVALLHDGSPFSWKTNHGRAVFSQVGGGSADIFVPTLRCRTPTDKYPDT